LERRVPYASSFKMSTLAWCWPSTIPSNLSGQPQRGGESTPPPPARLTPGRAAALLGSSLNGSLPLGGLWRGLDKFPSYIEPGAKHGD
jgi:hypothetical protein